MDLANFNTKAASDEGATLTLLHPAENTVLLNDDVVLAEDGKTILTPATPMTITVVGIDSDRFKSASRRVQNARAARARGRRQQQPTAEELDADNIQILVECTLGWNLTLGGKLEFTPENARRVYRDYEWIQEQVDFFIGERRNFLKAPKKT